MRHQRQPPFPCDRRRVYPLGETIAKLGIGVDLFASHCWWRFGSIAILHGAGAEPFDMLTRAPAEVFRMTWGFAMVSLGKGRGIQ